MISTVFSAGVDSLRKLVSIKPPASAAARKRYQLRLLLAATLSMTETLPSFAYCAPANRRQEITETVARLENVPQVFRLIGLRSNVRCRFTFKD